MASPPAVELRPLTEADYAVFRERSVPVYAEELARARDLPLEDALRSAEETFAPTLSEIVAEDRSWIFRVHSEGEPVGWLWLGAPPFGADGVFVYDVEVDEPHRGRGLGRAIMLAAEDFVRAQGFDRLGLNVFGGNSRAEALYRSLGYEVMSTSMRKTLGGSS